MARYEYESAMYADIDEYIQDNDSIKELIEEGITDEYEIESRLYNEMFIEDSITGNASGSYTFNSYVAEEYLTHNRDILGEAFEEFGWPSNKEEFNDAEYCDVTIRCYLLARVLSEWMNNNKDYIQDEIEKYSNQN